MPECRPDAADQDQRRGGRSIAERRHQIAFLGMEAAAQHEGPPADLVRKGGVGDHTGRAGVGMGPRSCRRGTVK